jgi:hypothetical protein
LLGSFGVIVLDCGLECGQLIVGEGLFLEEGVNFGCGQLAHHGNYYREHIYIFGETTSRKPQSLLEDGILYLIKMVRE